MKNKHSKEWTTNVALIEKPEILIDIEFIRKFQNIQNQFPEIEVTVLTKGEWLDETFYVSDDIYIPKQEVSETSVDLKEPPPFKEYNVNVHSHPFTKGNSSFSSTDLEEALSLFDACILFNDRDIVDAAIKIAINKKLRLIVKADFDIAMSSQEDIDTSMIKKKTWKRSYINHYPIQSHLFGEHWNDNEWDDEDLEMEKWKRDQKIENDEHFDWKKKRDQKLEEDAEENYCGNRGKYYPFYKDKINNDE